MNINTLQMWANEPRTELHCLVDQILISSQPLLLIISSKYAETAGFSLISFMKLPK